MSKPRRLVGCFLAALTLLWGYASAGPAAGSGQPAAGSDGWEEIREGRLMLRFRPESRPFAVGLMPELVSSLAYVTARLGGQAEAVTVFLAATETEFRALSGGRLPHWGAGYAFPSRGVILLRRFAGRQDVLIQTARHELAHIVLHRRVSGRVPVWFSEGVSMWIAREWRLGDSAEVFATVITGGLIPLSGIDQVLGFPSSKAQLAYTQSLLALTYLIGLGGPEVVREIVDMVSAGDRFESALLSTTGLTPGGFEAGFTAHVRQRFSLVGALTSSHSIWVYVTGLVVLAFVAVRWRNRTRTREWENEEDDLAALPPRLRLQARRREDRP